MIYLFKKNFRNETDRLILRPLEATDQNDIIEVLGSANSENPTNLTDIYENPNYKKDYFQLSEDLFDIRTRLVYGIELKKNGKIIGLKQLDFLSRMEYDDENDKYFIIYDGLIVTTSLLNKIYWANGYMTEATTKLIGSLFEKGVKGFLADIKPNNQRSINYNLKLGFKKLTMPNMLQMLGFFSNTIDPIDERKREDHYLLLSPNYREKVFGDFTYELSTEILDKMVIHQERRKIRGY